MPGSKRPALVAALAVVATGLFAATPAQAAVPTNDDFDNATVVTSLPYSDTSSTVEATRAPDDPACGSGGSIWYAYTPSADATLLADTAGSDFDTMLGVFTGQRGSLTSLGCNDDVGDLRTSQVGFQATAGTTYYFMVDGFLGSTGNVVFHLQVAPDPLTSVTVQFTKATVDRLGLVTVYGTITCDQAGSADIYLVGTQSKPRSRASGDAHIVTPCGTTPTAWSASMGSYTGNPFRPGKISLDYNALATNVTGFAGTSGQLVLVLSRVR